MARAEELFLRIKQGGAAEIERMIQDKVVEELFLDYKRAATSTPFRTLDPSDRKNLAKAIAGFANSEGGIIVWGVDCKPNPPYGDVPLDRPVPIADPNAFKSLLEGAITGVTLPSHPNVDNLVLLIEKQTGGFVVTYIPPGLNVPYRTLVDKEEYYIRAGSSFHPTPHAVLAGLFGRAPHPQLELAVLFRSPQATAGGFPVKLTFPIAAINVGRGIAEDLFFLAEEDLPEKCEASFVKTED
jgi:Putative DNA-binding domain